MHELIVEQARGATIVLGLYLIYRAICGKK